jgi:hypothetical protein
LAGHHHVEHDQVEVERFEPLARFAGAACRGDAKAVARQERFQELAQARIVVDDQDVRFVSRGLR